MSIENRLLQTLFADEDEPQQNEFVNSALAMLLTVEDASQVNTGPKIVNYFIEVSTNCQIFFLAGRKALNLFFTKCEPDSCRLPG